MCNSNRQNIYPAPYNKNNDKNETNKPKIRGIVLRQQQNSQINWHECRLCDIARFQSLGNEFHFFLAAVFICTRIKPYTITNKIIQSTSITMFTQHPYTFEWIHWFHQTWICIKLNGNTHRTYPIQSYPHQPPPSDIDSDFIQRNLMCKNVFFFQSLSTHTISFVYVSNMPYIYGKNSQWHLSQSDCFGEFGTI